MEAVQIVMAIGTVIVPVFFGCLLWKLGQTFVTRESFEDYKKHADHERDEMKGLLNEVRTDIKTLLTK